MNVLVPQWNCLMLAGVFLSAAPLTNAAESGNWPNWRGPQANGSTIGKYPTQLDASAIRWKVALPGKGSSTPIVWNNRVYLTSPMTNKDAVIALDPNGKQLWHTALGDEVAGRHRNGSGSNPSPATDGSGIFVTFKSGLLAALNLDGTVRWQKNLVNEFGPINLGWDHGTSPAITERDVVIARMHGGESWLAAFDKKTGAMRWKTPRNYKAPRENDNGYSTPLVIRHAGKEALLTWAADHLTAHDAANGKLLWFCGGFNPEGMANWPAIATPVVVDDIAVVAFGRADKGGLRLHGIKLGGKGDVTKTHRVWQREDAGAFVPTPAEYRGLVYLLTDRGEVHCVNPKTGKTVWSDAFPRKSTNFYASPLIAGGVMYAVREDGIIYVARVAEKFELLGEHQFEDRVVATLVPVADRLLVRGMTNLYCVSGD